MSGFEVFNDRSELVINTEERMVAVVGEQAIGNIVTWYNQATLQSPAFIDKGIGVTSLPLLSQVPPLTLLKPAYGACGCGNVYYSANAGQLKHLNTNYNLQSGYLDVFNPQGDLIWSAVTAEKVPRVVKVINVPAADLIAGTTINIGYDHIMMNNFPSIMYPGPVNALRVGGLYWRFNSDGTLNLQFKIRGNAVVSNYVNDAYGSTGMNFYIYRFAG